MTDEPALNTSEVSAREQAEAPKPKTLAQKILEIQDKVGVVKKQGTFDSGMGGGKYLRIEDAVVAVNKLLTANRLILTGTIQMNPDASWCYQRVPHTTKGYIANVVMQWRLEDVDDPLAYRLFYFPGDGYDGTDKAVYKAMTGSRKYAIINIFNLPIGNDVEEHGAPTGEELKGKQKNIAANKIAAAAAAGNKTAIDAMSQVEPEKKLQIARPEEFNAHYIIASGFIAVPQLDTFFNDTGCTRLNSKKTGKTGWKVPAEYERGLLAMCEKLGIEVEG